jgi:hypothetical protein
VTLRSCDAVQVAQPHVERVQAQVAGDVAQMRSITITPCGPPKPRKAVWLWVFVLQR